MKKRINNRMYDTETSVEVGVWDNSKLPNDFYYIEETLYRKRTGEYFLYGEGGAASRYAEPAYGGGSQAGCTIIPLTYEEALKWAEDHLDADECDAEFGEPVEDGTQEHVNFIISAQAKRKLQQLASQQGVSMGEMVETLVMRA